MTSVATRGDAPEGEFSKIGFAAEALPHLDAVYGFALRLARGRRDDAEDLVQDTFLRAYKAWARYENNTNCRSWLFTICRNVFLRRQEKRGRQEIPAGEIDADIEASPGTSAFAPVPSMDPETAFFDSFLDDEVLEAVDRLPAEFREAVMLSDLEGLSYAEIAASLDVPIGTVRSRLYRGRRLLQQALCDYALEFGYISAKRGREHRAGTPPRRDPRPTMGVARWAACA